MDQDQDIDIPFYFLCPISMEIMKDPVTVATGITYDRDAIERWIYSSKNATCPVTKQPVSLADMDLTPNHTLRRLIQSWCTLNDVERIPTPKPPVSRAHLSKLFSRAHQGGPRHLIASLRQLNSIALESAANCRALESAGAVRFLSSVVINGSGHENGDEEEEVNASVDFAVSVLSRLRIPEADLHGLQNGAVLINSLTRIINRSSNDECAVQLLKCALEAANPIQLAGLRPELFSGLMRVLKDPESDKTRKAALKILIHVCPFGRNKIKAVEAGAVGVMVEMLLGAESRRVSEMAVVVVEQLCGFAEGRAELVGHSGGLAVVSKRILRVSKLATERGVRVLWAVAKYNSDAVVKEMAEVGVVAKLCLVLQVECDAKSKERAKEILRLHAAAWKDSPCVPSHLYRSDFSLRQFSLV